MNSPFIIIGNAKTVRESLTNLGYSHFKDIGTDEENAGTIVYPNKISSFWLIDSHIFEKSYKSILQISLEEFLSKNIS